MVVYGLYLYIIVGYTRDTYVLPLLQKVHHRQLQTPLYRRFWPSVVNVGGDDQGHDRQLENRQ